MISGLGLQREETRTCTIIALVAQYVNKADWFTFRGCYLGTRLLASEWPTPVAGTNRRRPSTCKSDTECTSSPAL